jgi:hypothetical protein
MLILNFSKKRKRAKFIFLKDQEEIMELKNTITELIKVTRMVQQQINARRTYELRNRPFEIIQPEVQKEKNECKKQ